MMDSPEPFKNNNNGSSSASAPNNNSLASPQEESSYFRYVSSLSPINIKASHGTRCFIGLSSPPLVFKSPQISHRQRQFMQRTQQVRSQVENGGKSFGEAPGYYWKSNSHQPLIERFMIDTQKDFDLKNDANTQHYGGNLCTHKYLADPGDINQIMCSTDQDVEQQSTVAAEASLGDKESLPLPDDSSKVHQQIPVYVAEPEKMKGELSDVVKRFSHDPLLPQAILKYHDVGKRHLEFEEGASGVLGSNKSHEKLNATSNNVKRVELVESVTSTLYPEQGCGNLPFPYLNSMVNAMPLPTIQPATNGVRLPDTSPGMNMKRSIISSNVNEESSLEARTDSHEVADAIGAGNSEEFNKSHSPGKKKKKTSVPPNQGGCKRCNCKKSKCIKLYCDCFTAGVYCVGTCGCQDCLNRPEYDAMIMEYREQMKSRNQENSARHNKRGCKCKRSTCLKKYCECYQAKVGCSSGCQCQGCKNLYGKKEDYVASQHTSSSTEMLQRVLTPIEPPLQFSGKGNEVAKYVSSSSESSEDENSNNNTLLEWKSVSTSRFSRLTPNTTTESETRHLRCPGLGNTLFDMIVNEIQEASSTSVKVNSPSQKRVSPLVDREEPGDLGGDSKSKSSSTSVKVNPPLSPCVDSKSNNSEDLGESQSKGPNSPSR